MKTGWLPNVVMSNGTNVSRQLVSVKDEPGKVLACRPKDVPLLESISKRETEPWRKVVYQTTVVCLRAHVVRVASFRIAVDFAMVDGDGRRPH